MSKEQDKLDAAWKELDKVQLQTREDLSDGKITEEEAQVGRGEAWDVLEKEIIRIREEK